MGDNLLIFQCELDELVDVVINNFCNKNLVKAAVNNNV
jgi:hypothetical protein